MLRILSSGLQWVDLNLLSLTTSKMRTVSFKSGSFTVVCSFDYELPCFMSTVLKLIGKLTECT